MTKTSGRQIEVGIGIEATPGTAVAATDYFKWDSFSLQSMSEKVLLNSARGIRNKSSNSIINRKYGKGQLECVPTVDILPYILHLAMGTKVDATDPDASGLVYDHTFTINNNNASMKTATLLVKQGGIQTERYANAVVDSMELTFDKDFAKCKIDFIAGYPDTGSVTPAYTKDTLFTKSQLSIQFGASLSAAGSASATPVVNFMFSLKNSVQLEDAFLSGSNTPVAGGFIAGPLTLKGSYTVQFADTTELAKYQANTTDALIATVTGAAIGTSSYETIQISLGRLVLTKEPLEYKLEGINYVKQEFEVSYDATDLEATIEVINLVAGTSY